MGDSIRDRFDLLTENLLADGNLKVKYLFTSIIDMEVTQAIQYKDAHRHLTDPADRQPDNAVPLVRGKPAWVRVYVTSYFGPAEVLRGHLKIARSIGWLPVFHDVATLAAQAPGIVTTAHDSYATERSTLGTTLNFIIPADQMHGNLRLTAEIWRDGTSAASVIDSHQISVSANLDQTLAIRGVLIAYNGPNAAGTATLNLAAPTLANLATTAAWSLTTMPVNAQGQFSSAGTINWGTPLTGMALSPGGCSQQWLDLNAAIAQVRTNDGNRTDVIYYGLLPNGIPIANVGGCASSGVTSGRVGNGVTMAHEVGHACGLPHAPCGTPGDPNYPAYEPYDPAGVPMASIGEYGLDINDGTIRLPSRKDLMSYCGGDWFSLYNYQRLFDNVRLNPVWHRFRFRIPELVDPFLWPWEYLPDPPPPWLTQDWRQIVTESLVSVIAVVGPGNRIDVKCVMRLETTSRIDGAVTASGYALQMIGGNGTVVAEVPLMRLPSQGCGCGGKGDCGCDGGGGASDERGPFLAQGFLPDREPGEALRIVRYDGDATEPREIWVRKATKAPPRIAAFDVALDGEAGRAKWKAEGGGEQPLDFAIQVSKDDGRSWNNLAAGLKDRDLSFDATGLPAGELTFRLLAHDGFFTAKATTGPIRMRERAPGLAILHPREGSAIAAGVPMRLWAAVDQRNGLPIEPAACRWSLDGKEAGTGSDTYVTAPAPGRHTATVNVKTKAGTAKATVAFETYPDDDAPR
ncbi:M66 family metalloprotease [Defluviimonas sp. SAOS-178_SWC]|uniref:M66 family metalloprotease n=1 Tax=Defluviimonas sp. SAOS-178_SWC TaxID=3121287 RepID=UPI00322152E0